MENIKYTLFDLFVYSVPGSLFLFSIFTVCFSENTEYPFHAIHYILSDLDVYKAILFIAFSYCCGFLTSIIGGYLLSLKDFFFPIFKKGKRPINNSKKFVIVREKSKENFKYIEQWNVLKNFSSSLSTVFLLLTAIAFVFFQWFNIFYLLVGLTLSTLLIAQASKYHKWALIDLDNTFTFFIGEKS